VERLLRAAADLPRSLPAEQPADALWWRIVGEEARHRSTTPRATRMREPETLPSREAERLRQVHKHEEAYRMLTGLIDQACHRALGGARSASRCDVETEGHAAACLLDLHSVSLT
jgi:hypothetical protein